MLENYVQKVGSEFLRKYLAREKFLNLFKTTHQMSIAFTQACAAGYTPHSVHVLHSIISILVSRSAQLCTRTMYPVFLIQLIQRDALTQLMFLV